MRLTILYDDNILREGLRGGWGFSCLVEAEKKVLFDVGWNGIDLLKNMDALGVDARSIDVIVPSHLHWDHIGGLPNVLEKAKKAVVYAPASFSKHLLDDIRTGNSLVEVTEPVAITDTVWSTGELSGRHKNLPIMEQSLVLKTKDGIIALTGCSHPGVGTILAAAGKHGKVTGLIGGLHGFDGYELLNGLKLIVPVHCTQKRLVIREKYPDTTREGGVGRVIEV